MLRLAGAGTVKCRAHSGGVIVSERDDVGGEIFVPPHETARAGVGELQIGDGVELRIVRGRGFDLVLDVRNGERHRL
jgi:cold shock CspA family protein